MLRIEWTTQEPPPSPRQLLVAPMTTDLDADEVERRFGASIRAALIDSPFTGKSGETFSFTREIDGGLRRVVFLGVGLSLSSAESVRRFGHDAVRHAQSLGSHDLVIDIRGSIVKLGTDVDPSRLGDLMAQGVALGTYAYERFLTDRKPQTLERVLVLANDLRSGDGVTSGQIVANAICKARDLTNGPGELVTPTFLADAAKEIAARLSANHDVEARILERAECEARNMGCFLGVAKGSAEPPKFIHLRYTPPGGGKGRIALIGKGVTFDSGGYSLKPTASMLEMKMDMAGAAATLGAFEGAVGLGVPWELHVIVAATENMIGGRAYRLGDVLTASNGRTVEINNTDAEGRLTLADALVYASGLDPDIMIDFATLTGACVVALGPRIAGVMSHDERLVNDWMNASKRSGEPMWRLPLPDDLKEELKSKVADLRNTGERYGGAITAGLFLSEFAQGRRWLHVDIAGPAIVSKAHGITPVGGSGFAVATILEWLRGEIDLDV